MSASDRGGHLRRPSVSPSGHQEVLEAAAAAFARRGYATTTIDDIADELGSTKGRVYHYYRSKSDIFLDVLIVGMEDLLERLRPIVDDRDSPPEERLRQVAVMHAMVMMTRSSFQRVSIQGLEMHLLAETGKRHHAAMKKFIALRDEYEQHIADVIAEGVKSGVFRTVEPRLATKPILGALNWMNMWYHPRRGDQATKERFADEFAAFIVGGLRKGEDV